MQIKPSIRNFLFVMAILFLIGLLSTLSFDHQVIKPDLSLKPSVNYTGITLAFPGSYPSE